MNSPRQSKHEGPPASLLVPDTGNTGGGSPAGPKPNSIDASAANATGHETLYLGNLDGVIDRVQELFDVWEAEGTFSAFFVRDVLHRARLVLHEWIANLIQHADFEDRNPEIALSLWADDDRLRGIVIDNAIGFDLREWPEGRLEDVALTLPNRGMGLLLVRACTTDCTYHHSSDRHHNRFEFTIS